VQVNDTSKHGITLITNRSNKNRGTKLITILATFGLKIGRVYKLATRSLVLNIKYEKIPLSFHSVYVAQNKATETIDIVTNCNTHILPKITSPVYCTTTPLCTASVYCALCTQSKTNDVQTKQPIGRGQRVYTDKVNNPGMGGRGGVYFVLCQSSTERVTLHTHYFFRKHVAWSTSEVNVLSAHCTTCVSITLIVFSAELSNSLRWLLSKYYWHKPSLVPFLLFFFTNSTMSGKKFGTFPFSHKICLRIYISVCDTTAVSAAAIIFQFRSLTQFSKSSSQNTTNVLAHFTVKSVERKMSSVSPPCDEETAGKYSCWPLTIPANLNFLSSYPINMMPCMYMSVCVCTAAAAICLSYIMYFPRNHCLNLTILARNGSTYYGE